jgi:hypothetical protein
MPIYTLLSRLNDHVLQRELPEWLLCAFQTLSAQRLADQPVHQYCTAA